MKILNRLTTKKALIVVSVVSLAVLGVASQLSATPVLADTGIICSDNLPSELRAECEAGEAGVGAFITSLISVLLLIVGIAAVVILIVAGLMYVLSGGDPDRVKTAKNMIIYSVVGIVIAFGGRAIIAFVLSNV